MEVDTLAKACPRCGRPNPTAAPLTLQRVLRLVVVTILGAILIPFALAAMSKSCESRPPAQMARPTIEPQPQPESWRGPALWVETLQSVLKKSKTVKPFDTFRKDGITRTVYKLDPYEANSAAILERIDGKPAAWRWSVTAVRVLPADLAPRDQFETLFKTASDTSWFKVRAGEFEGGYVAFSPAKKAGREALLSLQTLPFAQEKNDEGLMPWLCANGRVAGAVSMSSEGMAGRCEALVREMLKAPSTAKFSWDDEDRPSFYGNCNMEWTSWVEAKNAFGVPIKNTFVCTYSAQSGQLKARFR
jgi:hypothetical protein